MEVDDSVFEIGGGEEGVMKSLTYCGNARRTRLNDAVSFRRLYCSTHAVQDGIACPRSGVAKFAFGQSPKSARVDHDELV